MNKDISTPRKAISKKSKTIQKVNNADKTTDKEESEKNIVLFVGHFDGGDVTVESQIEAVKHLKKIKVILVKRKSNHMIYKLIKTNILNEFKNSLTNQIR